jgi:hypothetical protein
LDVTGLASIVAQHGSCPTTAAKLIDAYPKSSDPNVQRRCLEFQTIVTKSPYLLEEVFPADASLEDVVVDVDMSFFFGIVSQAISNGTRCYHS